MIKIRRHLKSIGLQSEFWKVCFGYFIMLCGGITAVMWIERYWYALPGYFLFAVYHHFYTNKAVYELKAKYRVAGINPVNALKQYQTELCFIHTENDYARKLWLAATSLTAVTIVLGKSMPYLAFRTAIVIHLLFIYKEYRYSEYYDEDIKKE